MRKIFLFSLFFLCVFAINCGYTTRSVFIEQYRTVYVAPFENLIDFTAENRSSFYFPLIEIKTRNQVMDRFLFDGNLRVAEPETADLIIRGALKDYTRGALRYTDDDDVQEYRVQVYANVTLEENRTGKVLWKKRVVGESTYFVSGSLAGTESTAVDAAIVDLARRIVENVIEYW